MVLQNGCECVWGLLQAAHVQVELAHGGQYPGVCGGKDSDGQRGVAKLQKRGIIEGSHGHILIMQSSAKLPSHPPQINCIVVCHS